MNWLAWVRWQLDDRQIESLIDEIGARCRQTVVERVLPRIAGMSLPEARGYLRARSARLVPCQAVRVVVAAGLPRESATWLGEIAKQDLIERTLLDVRKRRWDASWRRKAA
ncbi:MAG: hypothetical protein HUU20_28495 [Pirellulales bacterium]|nr:hypothetical protein [Pirellulales bacterium]